MNAAARPSLLTTLSPLLLALTAAAAPPPLQNARIGRADFADPFVLREGDTYYAFATGANGKHVQVGRSKDLAAWTALPDALPTLPSWAVRGEKLTWAPSALRRSGGYVLYYTAPDAVSGFQCISRATSASPAGPYVDDSARPFVCDARLCGSIDPSPFVDDNGRAYLYWKSDENSVHCRGTSRIWAQALADDGLDVTGSPSLLLTTDQPWERPLIEGPSMTSHDGRFFLFYSANWYESPDYAIGYGKCTHPLGPCEKMTKDVPLARSAGTTLGPGGQEFFDDASGTRWMAYHAWTAPDTTYAAGGARSLRFARVSFADGVPKLGL